MGRGKQDTCENCTNYDERREICRLDRKEVEKNNWCKHHNSQEDD